MATGQSPVPEEKVLKKGGRYVSITAKLPAELAESYRISASIFLFLSDAGQLNEIVNLIKQNIVKVFLDKVFPLTAAKEALAYQQLGHSKGINVLTASLF